MQSNTAPAGAVVKELIFVFDYRTIVEAEDLDHINYESWKEVLDAFGYANLSFDHFMRNLVIKSPAEVMASLCPYTTKAEWPPILARRASRLQKDIGKLCYTEMLPISGLKDFIIDCAQHAHLTCVFLSPFPEDVTQNILAVSEVAPYIDAVHCYSDSEFSLFDALERINVRPPLIPNHLREGKTTTANANCEKTNKLSQGSNDVGGAVANNKPAIIVFVSNPLGAKCAAMLGCKTVGVSFNGGYAASSRQEYKFSSDSEKESEKTKNADDIHKKSRRRSFASVGSFSEPGIKNNHIKNNSINDKNSIIVETTDESAEKEPMLTYEQSLLAAGAATVIKDFTALKYEYLEHILPTI